MTMYNHSIYQSSRIHNLQPRTPIWKTYVAKASAWLENYLAKSKRQTTVRNALMAVAAQHPDWADVGFDEHFVTHQGQTLMTDYVRTGQMPNASAIAVAWSNQFHWKSTTKQDAQQRFMRIAEDFVYILETEAA